MPRAGDADRVICVSVTGLLGCASISFGHCRMVQGASNLGRSLVPEAGAEYFVKPSPASRRHRPAAAPSSSVRNRSKAARTCKTGNRAHQTPPNPVGVHEKRSEFVEATPKQVSPASPSGNRRLCGEARDACLACANSPNQPGRRANWACQRGGALAVNTRPAGSGQREKRMSAEIGDRHCQQHCDAGASPPLGTPPVGAAWCRNPGEIPLGRHRLFGPSRPQRALRHFSFSTEARPQTRCVRPPRRAAGRNRQTFGASQCTVPPTVSAAQI